MESMFLAFAVDNPCLNTNHAVPINGLRISFLSRLWIVSILFSSIQKSA